MPNNLTYQEPELVALLKDKDERGFSYLYDNYAGALNGIILQIIPDQNLANDILQEVFVNIWRRIDTYDAGKGRLFTWMLNIARNAAIDELRSKGYNNSIKNISLPENNEIAGAVTGPAIDDVGLKKVLGQLKGELRVLVDMSYFKGFTQEEIARSLDIPLGTVKTRIRSALTQLRTMIQ